MPELRPISAIRPTPDFAASFVLSGPEHARPDNPRCFYSVFKEDIEDNAAEFQETVAHLFREGKLVEEPDAFYVYRQKNGQHVYTGLMGAVRMEDIKAGQVKKHEKVYPDRVQKLATFMKTAGANPNPVLLAAALPPSLKNFLAEVAEAAPLLHVVLNGCEHMLWKSEPEATEKLLKETAHLPALYIADGHHRQAAVESLPENDLYCLVLPEEDLNIHSFYRLLQLPKGFTAHDFIGELSGTYETVRLQGNVQDHASPGAAVVLTSDGAWLLKLPQHLKEKTNPVERLDVCILEDHILPSLPGMRGQTDSQTLTYLSGNYNFQHYRNVIGSDSQKVVIMLYPLSFQEIAEVSNNQMELPAKSTWIEPKIPSGMLMHKIK